MNNELKEFYTLSELEVLVAENLDIDINNTEKLNEIIFHLVSDNHLVPFLEYKGLAGIVESVMPLASFEITETLLDALEKPEYSSNKKELYHLYEYSPTISSVKNLIKTFEHGYCTKPPREENKTHAIFRLSPLCILNTPKGIQVELGFTKPVAHIKRFIDDPIENNEYEFLGYQLYPSDQVNTPRLNINETCKLLFDRLNVDCLFKAIKTQHKISDNISSLSIVEQNNKSTRSQDSKLIAVMAIMLSKKSSQFKYANKPNRSAITREIKKLTDELQIDRAHTYGLEAPDQRIKQCLEEFSEFFFTTNDSKH